MPQQGQAGGLPETSQDWAGLIAALAQDQGLAEQALDGIEAARRPLALASMTGDRKAAQQVAALNAQEAELRAVIATRRAALEDAEGRRQASAEREREAQAAIRREQLRLAAQAVVADAARVDAAARELAEALGAFNAGVGPLGRLGLGVTELRRLRSPSRHVAAMHAAALHAALPLERIRSSFWQPLAALARQTLAVATGDAAPAPAMPQSFVGMTRPQPPAEPTFSAEDEEEEERMARRMLRGSGA